jgi:Flp pilus assembly protein TadG
MAHDAARSRARRRGSTLVESSMVATVFLLLLAGIMECGRLGFAYNAVSFAAQRAARYAAVRGSGSGHAALATDIAAAAKSYTAALDNRKVTVTTTWTPDNHPGSTVQVKVSYAFVTVLVPLSASAVTVRTTSQQIIIQ